MKKLIILIATITLFSCQKEEKNKNGKLQVVATTTMINDLVKNIGGDKIEIEGLMGAGVDPHLFSPSAGDVTKLLNADVVVYNGLHLEGKLEDVFEKMKHQNKKTIVIADALTKSNLISSKNFKGNFDPHIWFDINNWSKISIYVGDKLATYDPKNADFYKKNASEYVAKLQALDVEVKSKISEIPKEQRILVTAHDAFCYFGEQQDFKVVGLQGLSTATEAGVQDVRKMSDFIIKNNIKAIFVETSVSDRTVKALQEAVKSKGHDVVIGGSLYSDALGATGKPEGTYIGMYKANINTIVNALK